MATQLISSQFGWQGKKKYHHQPHGWLIRAKKGAEPQIPHETRWGSQNACVQTFVSNFNLYCEIMNEHEDEIELTIMAKLNNLGIYRNAIDLKAQLELVNNSL
jgi:hypothetical protein